MNDLTELAKSAGAEIMKYYHAGDAQIFEKQDLSPVTDADLAANRVLMQGLKLITPDIPIVSEESDPLATVVGDQYWLVDPLDGTRDFIAKRDTFVVCMGLIDRGEPVAGFIHAPVFGLSWWAQKGDGAFADGSLIYNHSRRTQLIVAGSRSVPSEKMQRFYDLFSISGVQRYGSALKFCRLAEGQIDMYPRFGMTCEWDTAAGQIIAEEAGCKVIEVRSRKRLAYGKSNRLNDGGFIASRADLDFVEPIHREFGHLFNWDQKRE